MKTLRMWGTAAALLAAALLVVPGPGHEARLFAQQSQQDSLRQFSTTPIDVAYQAANVRTVLRSLADMGGVNLVIDPSVPADLSVDLALKGVPWYQIMDIVLQSGQLTYELEGNVLRVLTREARTKELDDQTKQKRATEAMPDLETARIRLNYATAADIAKLMSDAHLLSSRGTVDVESRTNMLIIRDTPKDIAEMRGLLTDLDRAEPQVEIEAKILRTNRDTAKALGVQWGVNGRMAPELGNTSGVGFPNRGAVGGRVVGDGDSREGPNDPRASDLERTATAVNLPATGANSALGLSLGAINGSFGLDVALSALEHEGKAKILSTPRVTTQNNQKAEITQGFQVPFQTVANNTVTVQYRDAALKLTVTPQITAANTVIMKITLENGTPDFSRAVNGNPSINTQRAETQVQVGDGVTTVIGGILQTTETTALDETPGVSRIPLLGFLFKRNDVRSESQELMILITPRIIRG